MKNKNILSIDFGGMSVKYFLINSDKTIDKHVTKSKEINDKFKLTQNIKDVFEKMENKHGKIEGLAISFCSPIMEKEIVRWGFTRTGEWKNFNIKQFIEDYKIISKDRVKIINDAKAAVYAEMKVGSAIGYNNITMLTYGTGIGGAAIIEGELVNGKYGLGAELSSPIMYWDGENLETAKSWARIASMTVLEIDFYKHSGIKKNGKEIFELYDNGDESARKAVQKLLKGVALQVYNCCYIYGSEIIIIGGGISNRETVIEEIKHYLDQFIQIKKTPFPSKLVKAKLSNEAGAYGAYYYFLDQYEANK